MSLTGRDQEVIDFLNNNPTMQQFLKNVYEIIDAAIDDYTSRDFTSLMVSFGCTGGQHRSVYAAECLNSYLKSKYDGKIGLVVKHTELDT